MARTTYRTEGEGQQFVGKTTIEIRSKDADYFKRQARPGEPMYSVVWKILDAFRAKDIDGYLEQYHQLYTAHTKTLELVDNLKQQLESMTNEIKKLKNTQGLMVYADEYKKTRFMEIFDNLEAGHSGEVPHEILMNSLTHPTNKITTRDAGELIREAMTNGKIYERRNGVYAKA